MALISAAASFDSCWYSAWCVFPLTCHYRRVAKSAAAAAPGEEAQQLQPAAFPQGQSEMCCPCSEAEARVTYQALRQG